MGALVMTQKYTSWMELMELISTLESRELVTKIVVLT